MSCPPLIYLSIRIVSKRFLSLLLIDPLVLVFTRRQSESNGVGAHYRYGLCSDVGHELRQEGYGVIVRDGPPAEDLGPNRCIPTKPRAYTVP